MDKGKNKTVIWVLAVVFLLLCAVIFGIRQYLLRQNALPAQNRDTFCCYTYDEKGHRLEGFWSEPDGAWYLFLTSTQSVKGTWLYTSGSVAQTTRGILDSEAGILYGGFSQNGDRVTLTTEDGTEHTVVVLQSSLPSVYIDLQQTSLTQIHADQTVKYDGNSLYITDPEGKYDLTAENNVQIKGRGNSSWQVYDKKGYQIKFDTKIQVLGMNKAKKWVLLANAGDDSLMRFQLASRAAQSWDMAFVPEFAYVDLWIDGEYLGTYLLGEKVEIDESRLNLTHAAGALFEHDEDFYLDEENWFVTEVMNRHFALKEMVVKETAVTQTVISDFDDAVNELMVYLYSTPSDQVSLEALSQRIDVDSFAKYYLLNEYMQNWESYSTSFYWYKDGPEDVLHLGPIWDFDTCMGSDGEPATASYGYNHPMFRYLLAAPVFYQRTQQLMEIYGESLKNLTRDTEVLEKQIASSAHMNYCRWDTLGMPNPKGGPDLSPTFEAAVENLRTWLAQREAGFTIHRGSVITSRVSADCREIQLRFDGEEAYEQIVFSLWSRENGQDDIRWYMAQQAPDGSWQATVDLTGHNCAGVYYFNAYAQDQTILLATGRNFVKTAVAPKFPMETTVSPDGRMLYIYLTDVDGGLRDVRLGIWGAEERETTFRWQETEQTADGQWSACMSSCALNLTQPQTVVIHAYGTDAQGEESLVSEAHVEFAQPIPHTYGDDSNICAVCGMTRE